MTRVLLCSVFVFICVLVASVKCQEDEGDDKGLWDRFLEIFESAYNALRRAWNDLKEEIKARAADFGGWTREAWDSFKQKMNEWVNERTDIDDYEKSEMRKYIERLEMPEEGKE